MQIIYHHKVEIMRNINELFECFIVNTKKQHIAKDLRQYFNKIVLVTFHKITIFFLLLEKI